MIDEPTRTFLAVLFAANSTVRKLGAKFDKASRLWYVPEGLPLAEFRRWVPRQEELTAQDIADAKRHFVEDVARQELVIKGAPIFDNEKHRRDLTTKNGKNDSEYCVRIEANRIFGWFINYQIHTERPKWHANNLYRPRYHERRRLREIRAEQSSECGARIAERQERVAVECENLWADALPLIHHPYLVRKGGKIDGRRQGVPGKTVTSCRDDGSEVVMDINGRIFVPLRDAHETLVTPIHQ